MAKRGLTPIITTLAAGVPATWGIKGNYFHVLDAPVDDLTVRFDDGTSLPVYKGLGFDWGEYERVTLESATGQAVKVLAGFGSVADARASANVNVTTNVAPGNTLDDGGDVSVPDSSVTQLLAADADRLYAVISLPSTAAGPVRVGTSSVSLTSGWLLEPGMQIPIATTAALYAYHENGTSVSVAASAVKEV